KDWPEKKRRHLSRCFSRRIVA
ncbi:hypothetical protein EAG_14764, partial [Camponotus floridanus]